MKTEYNYHDDMLTNIRTFELFLYIDTDPGEIKRFIKARLDDILGAKKAVNLKLQIHKGFSRNPYCENICKQLVDYWLAHDHKRAKDFYALCKEKGFIP